MRQRCRDADVARDVGCGGGVCRVGPPCRRAKRSTLLLDAGPLLEREAEWMAELRALETGNSLATQTRGEVSSMVDIGSLVRRARRAELRGQDHPVDARALSFYQPHAGWPCRRHHPLECAGNYHLSRQYRRPQDSRTGAIGRAARGRTPAGGAASRCCQRNLRIWREAGKPLVEHPLVRKVTFTGSSAVGMQIMHYAADKLIPVTAELGGLNPNIVLPDADLGLAIPGIIQGLRLFRQDNPARPAPASTFTRTSIAKSSTGWSRPSAPAASVIRSTTPPKSARSFPPSSWPASSATSKWPGKRPVRAF